MRTNQVILNAETAARVAMRTLFDATAQMIADTGGQSGRDFTDNEEAVFNHLIDAGQKLGQAFPSSFSELRAEVGYTPHKAYR